MSGMFGPELIAEKLIEIQAAVWQDAESTLHLIPVLPKAHPMSEADWSTVFADYHLGRAALTGLMDAKVGLWRRLPWMLCVLAHVDEEQARRFWERSGAGV